MVKSGTRYKASKKEIDTLKTLESIFDFKVSISIFTIMNDNDEPLVLVDTFGDSKDSLKLQKFAKKNFPKKWYWSNWGFYVNYKDILNLIKCINLPINSTS